MLEVVNAARAAEFRVFMQRTTATAVGDYET